MSGVIQSLSFCDWLITLSIMSSGFIQVVACDRISFFKAAWYSIVWLNHIFFIHSAVDGHLGCLYSLAVVNSAAVNMGIQISFPDSAFKPFGYNHMLNHTIVLFLIFWETTTMFSTVSAFYISTSNTQGFQFLHIHPHQHLLLSASCYLPFNNSHPDRCKVISHCGFDSQFSNYGVVVFSRWVV